jgi:hypothetical protein
MIADPQELYRFLTTPGIEVAALVFSSDYVVCSNGGISPKKKCPTYVILMRL